MKETATTSNLEQGTADQDGLRFFAPCAKGLEYLLVDELKALGATSAHEALAGVHFAGDPEAAYRAVLWSRLASRILWPLAEFDAPDDHALYEGASGIDWSQHLAPDGSLAVDAHVSASRLAHSQFAAQRVKDAVVDQFRRRFGNRPSVDLDAPDVRIDLHLQRDRARLALDLSGGGLHRRGWRRAQGAAPLKESLAAAMLLRAGWPQLAAAGASLLDPMCGSGTLLIEGLQMAADIAPGLLRGHDGLTGWRGLDDALWQRLRVEARHRAEAGRRKLRCQFFGRDVDADAISSSRRNVESADMVGLIDLEVAEIAATDVPAGVPAGLVICNPPYDQRLAADPALYRRIGERMKARFCDWRLGLLAGDAVLAKATGLRASKTYTLFNGALRCLFLRVDRTETAAPTSRATAVLGEGAQMVANRLRKNLRKLDAWRQREEVSCFRVYDADLPEYAAAIDVYTEAANASRVWLHVQEYRAPSEIPEADTRRRFGELLRAADSVFELPRERIAIKQRSRGKGGSKHSAGPRQARTLIIAEDGLRFEVNLFDYLDTGLFLDHRPARRWLRRFAAGKRVLNLFSYTGAASVYAAAGGAQGTVSVDLSSTYLEWAQRNFALNGLVGAAQRLVQADALAWVTAESSRFDLIFCDPPTFSNSARAADFDVQRDHVRLLRACLDRLSVGGTLLFSNNFRRFKLDSEAFGDTSVEEISAAMLPPDFSRNPRIHRVWRFDRGG